MRPDEIAVSADEKYLSVLFKHTDEFYMASNNIIVTYELKTGREVGRCNKVSGDENLCFWGNTYLLTTISRRTNLVEVWDAIKGKNLVNLTHFKNQEDWIVVTPEGYYDGNMESLKKFYFVLGNEVVDPDLYFEKFYTPRLFERVVNGEVFETDVADLKDAPVVEIKYSSATRNLEVDNDVPTFINTTGKVDITVSANAKNDAIDEIRLFHNGKIVQFSTRNLLIVDDSKQSSASQKYQIELVDSINTFMAVAVNTQRTESKPQYIEVHYSMPCQSVPEPNQIVNNSDNEPMEDLAKDAVMHLIVVGINEYKNPQLKLNYALADALSFREVVEKDARKMVNSIQTYFITDLNADKEAISKAFKEVREKARPRDVFVFYYAGHGVIGTNNEFYLVPTDVVNFSNVTSDLESKGIPSKFLQQSAIDIRAQKQVFMLDACQSAGAFQEMLTVDATKQKSIAMVARSTGTHWIAASGSKQYANEFSALGHGAFTYIVLEALNGAASTNHFITVNQLKNYLKVAVPDLLKKYHGTPQYPVSYGFGKDFPISLRD
jgi:hypothetical protein